MKKYYLIIMVVGVIMSMLIGVLVSCSKDKEVENPNEITYYFWEEPTILNAIKKFNSTQDEITVIPRALPINNYEIKILALLSAKENVDTYAQKTQSQTFDHYENGFIAPLEEIDAAKNFDFSIYDRYKSSLTVDNRYVALPFRGGNRFIYFNKVLFDKANEPYPTTYSDKGKWTWEKLEEVATRIHEKLGVYGINFHTWTYISMTQSTQDETTYINADGTLNIDDHREAILGDFTRRKRMEQSGTMWPMQDLKVTKMHYSTAFFGGNVAMLQIGEWFPGMLLNAKNKNLFKDFTWDDWGIAPLPNNRKVRVNPREPTYAHVTGFSEKKDAAFMFLRWLAGPGGAAELAKSGFLPAIVTDEVKENLRSNFPDEKSLEVFLAPSDKLGPNNIPAYSAGIDRASTLMLDEYLLNDMTNDELFESFRKKLEQVVLEN